MATKPLRLLHAANLRLDCPLQSTGQLNDEIREIVDQATLVAFDRLIALAIDKDVDALIITGNSFDASYASLAAEVAMREGFARLTERHIPVLVTPGKLDPVAAWQELPRLSDHVTVFTDINDTPVDLTDHGQLLATFVPVTSDTSIEPEELSNILGGRTNSKGDRPFIVGLLLGDRNIGRHKVNPSRFAALDWLVGPDGIDTDSLPLTDGLVHLQKSAQGLNLLETGIHGATLLEVDVHRKTRQTLIPLAPVRWERIVQSIDRVKGRDELLERMLGQLERLSNAKGELVRIVHWKLERTIGEANGWELETAAKELASSLTELTDQPDGLRYVHRVSAVESDLTLVEPGHREVLTEFLLAIGRRAPANHDSFKKWVTDAHFDDSLKLSRWEHWMTSTSAESVTERAQQLVWKWFATIGKK